MLSRGDAESAKRTEFYDEPRKRMDEWMVGRRHVALAGGRRAGGGPAGRRDWQAIQEIIHYPPNSLNLERLKRHYALISNLVEVAKD